MPVPSAVASLYLRLEMTSTMPGSTLVASALAFSEPVPVFVLPEPPEPLAAVDPLPAPEDGYGFALPKGLDCEPFPLSGLSAGLAEEAGAARVVQRDSGTRASGGREHRDGHVGERPAET